MNGEPTAISQCKTYPQSKAFTENSLGCKILSGECRAHFTGEMSAVHFVSISTSNVIQTHNLLKKAYNSIEVHDIFPFIAFSEGVYKNSPKLQKAFSFKDLSDLGILERLFLSANPKFATKSLKPNEEVYVAKYRLKNQIQKIYKQTKVYHNMSAKDIFFNIGGTAALLPFLYNLSIAQHELRNDALEKVIELIIESALSDIEKTGLLFGHKDGLMVLSYLFEKLASKVAFSETILNALKKLMDVIKEYYSGYAEQYLENVFYNPGVWRYSSEAIQDKILEHMNNNFVGEKNNPQKIAYHVDILFNFLEVYINQERLNKLKSMILTICYDRMNRETLFTLLGYANAFFVRRLKNHPIQIFYVLSIFLEVYVSRNNILVNDNRSR